MFVVGFGYGGRLEMTRMLGDRNRLQEFRHAIIEKTGAFPAYFIVVFEVRSIERTGFTNELRYVQEIPDNFFRK